MHGGAEPGEIDRRWLTSKQANEKNLEEQCTIF